MSGQGLHPRLRALVARNLRVDWLTVEISGAFADEEIESMVLKGPALAEWLYPTSFAPTTTPISWSGPGTGRRRSTFSSGSALTTYLEPMAHPRMESFASTAFVRGLDNVDLHCTLHGLDESPEVVVATLMATAVRQAIGNGELWVPGRVALLLHVGLHAAHHAEGKAIEDLRRAIAEADDRLWAEAAALARVLDGLPAFASGVQLLPEGVALARRLGIEGVRSPRHELRRQRIPVAEGIDALLTPGLGTRRRAATLAREFFPPAEFMRWWTPLASRGRTGLAVAYVWRTLWLFANAPRGLYARWRVRRGGASPRPPSGS